MSTEFFRKYMDIVDEAVRGVLVNPGAGTDGKDYAVRPSNQAERDQIAKGLKAARTYNRDAAAYAVAPGEKQDGDPAELSARAREKLEWEEILKRGKKSKFPLARFQNSKQEKILKII